MAEISDILKNMVIGPWHITRPITGPPYMPAPANDQPPPSQLGSRAHMQSLLDDRFQLISTLTGMLNRATTLNSPFYDSDQADRVRGLIRSASNDAQMFRDQVNQLTPKGMTGLLNPPPGGGPSAAMPLTSPTLVTRPGGSGSLFSEEQYLQRQREGLQPPGQND